MSTLHVSRLLSIGAVEAGDNPEADILFYKRDAAMSGGGFPIASTQDLKNAIQAIGRAKNPDTAKRHIIRRARALGKTALLPDSWNVHKREPSEGRHREGGPMALDLDHLDDDTREPIEKHISDLASQVTDLQKQLEEASTEEDPDALPDDLPDSVVKALAERDEVLAKEREHAQSLEKRLAKMEDDTATERATLRAGELRNLFGNPDEVAPILKALAAADPDAYAKLDDRFDTLVSVDGFSKLLEKEIGEGGEGGTADDKILGIAKKLREEHPDTFPTMAAAKAEAWDRNPDLLAAAREEVN